MHSTADLFAPELLVLLDAVEGVTEGLARHAQVTAVHPSQLVQPPDAAEVGVQLLRLLQVPDDLAEDPDQVHLGVHHLPPGQVIHAQLLVKLIELLNVLPQLE